MFDSYSGIFLLLSGAVGFSVVWSLIFLPFKLLGVHLYYIDDEREINAIKKNISKTSSIVNNNEQLGWVFGKYYVGYFFKSGDHQRKTPSCYILAHASIIEKCKVREEYIETNEYINVFDRCGHYDYIYYTERRLDVTDFQARSNQKRAIATVVRYYEKNKNATVLLSGNTNVGKSVMSILLAKELHGSIVYEFNPSEPGNNFNSLYNKASPTAGCPMIVALEEIDIMIDSIHHGKIPRHESKPIAIYNKTTWNMFMDNIDHKFYPHVIFLFTTNKPFEWFDELDPSYMRSGRISLRIKLEERSADEETQEKLQEPEPRCAVPAVVDVPAALRRSADDFIVADLKMMTSCSSTSGLTRRVSNSS